MMAEERRSNILRLAIVGFTALVLITLLWFTNIHAQGLSLFVICMAALVAVHQGIIPVMDLLGKWQDRAIQGAEGEETVGAILDRVPNMHLVQHDVPGAYGNIDHLVFRKDGAVFLLETKSHRGKIEARNSQLLRNGKSLEKDFIKQVERNVVHVRDDLRARYELKPWVHAAVVFTKAFVEPHCKVGHVDVINISYLERWMDGKPGQAELARRMADRETVRA